MGDLTRRTWLGGLSAVGLVTGGAGWAHAATGSSDVFDLVVKDGEVLDPSQSLRGKRDIGVRGGVVVAVEADIPAWRARQVLDASGTLVLPSAVDLHAHFHPLEATTVRDEAQAQAHARVVFSGAMVGVKVSNAALQADGLELLARALRIRTVSDEAVRVMVDVTGLSTTDMLSRTFDLLRPGDVVTRCYASTPDDRDGFTSIAPNGRLLPAVMAAKRRGVVFDTGKGGGSFDFEVARTAIAQGVVPDTIAADVYTTRGNTAAVPRLSSAIGKLLHLGLSLDRVVSMATLAPARLIGFGDKLGTLQVGAPGNVSVMRRVEESITLVDTAGTTHRMSAGLKPTQFVDTDVLFA